MNRILGLLTVLGPRIRGTVYRLKPGVCASCAALLAALCLLPVLGRAEDVDMDVEMDTGARIAPGATEIEVRKVMHEPTRTNAFGRGVEYVYGQSLVKFENGAMVQWYPVDRLIPVFMEDRKPGAAPIVVGSTTNQVLDAMGTPSGLTASEFPRRQETWHYGFSSIVIVKGRVESWRDAWNLIVSPKTNNIGSTEWVEAELKKNREPTNSPPARAPSQATIIYSNPGGDFPQAEPTYVPFGNGGIAPSSSGNVHVRGYTRQNGTYVAPHTRSLPRR